jgi:N-methylhydantoinase A/oxoprolinase/acetone carboxylase beta subunit
MHERAATAGLHAKLMPVMDAFIHGVETAMTKLGLSCPALVIGGVAWIGYSYIRKTAGR